MQNLLLSRRGRRLFFTALYLSEGAPIGFIWWALPTKLRAAGMDVGTITSLTSLLVLPWVFKFLWAPLIDGIRTPRWTLRSWIVTTQLLAGLFLLPLLALDLSTDIVILVPFLLLSTIAAATQDASIDALAIATVPPAERGSVNGWMQMGMLVGRSALGGGALLLDQRFGLAPVVLLLVAVVWSTTLLVVTASASPSPDPERRDVRASMRAIVPRLRNALQSRRTWFGLLFAGVAGAGFEGAGAVAGPLLIDRGFTQAQVGTFFALPSVVAMALGALAGGTVADRIGPRRAVTLFLLLLSGSLLVLAGIDAGLTAQPEVWLLPAMTVLYGCIGMFTASSYALFMDITDPALGATQFSAFMGATNACEAWAAAAVGRAVPAWGYPLAFVALTMASLASLPLLKGLKPPDTRPNNP